MTLASKPELTAMKDALFQAMSTAPYGAVFPYSALSEIMNAEAVTYRHILLTVGRRLEREAQRVLESLRGIGYRIALPRDHVTIGAKRQDKGRKQIEGALTILKATPLAQLLPEERRRHDAFLILLHQQADVLRATQRVVQQASQEMTSFVDSRLKEAEARLATLGESS